MENNKVDYFSLGKVADIENRHEEAVSYYKKGIKEGDQNCLVGLHLGEYYRLIDEKKNLDKIKKTLQADFPYVYENRNKSPVNMYLYSYFICVGLNQNPSVQNCLLPMKKAADQGQRIAQNFYRMWKDLDNKAIFGGSLSSFEFAHEENKIDKELISLSSKSIRRNASLEDKSLEEALNDADEVLSLVQLLTLENGMAVNFNPYLKTNSFDESAFEDKKKAFLLSFFAEHLLAKKNGSPNYLQMNKDNVFQLKTLLGFMFDGEKHATTTLLALFTDSKMSAGSKDSYTEQEKKEVESLAYLDVSNVVVQVQMSKNLLSKSSGFADRFHQQLAEADLSLPAMEKERDRYLARVSAFFSAAKEKTGKKFFYYGDKISSLFLEKNSFYWINDILGCIKETMEPSYPGFSVFLEQALKAPWITFFFDSSLRSHIFFFDSLSQYRINISYGKDLYGVFETIYYLYLAFIHEDNLTRGKHLGYFEEAAKAYKVACQSLPAVLSDYLKKPMDEEMRLAVESCQMQFFLDSFVLGDFAWRLARQAEVQPLKGNDVERIWDETLDSVYKGVSLRFKRRKISYALMNTCLFSMVAEPATNALVVLKAESERMAIQE